jgi:D-methionine transport system substrate-binding protein
MKKNALILTVIVAMFAMLVGCGGNQADRPASANSQPAKSSDLTKIKVGVTGGPHEEIMEKVKEVAKQKEGLDIELVVFNDYVLPNTSLTEGEINANSFQTIPFLNDFNAQHKANLVQLAKTVTFPMGIYSTKYKKIEDIPAGATIGIQNDPTQRARALQLYEKSGLIKLKSGVGDKATPHDITDNPKKLVFKELDASFLARSLGDLDAASINTNFAMEAGYSPKKDAIFAEGAESPYVNVISVNAKDKDNPVFQKLVNAYRSEEVKTFINEHFKGAVLASW